MITRMKRTKEEVKNLIENYSEMPEMKKRHGMKSFMIFLNESGFFECPASTRFHGAYFGGLAEHCLNLYELFCDLYRVLGITLDWDSVFICCFGHDVCKIGLYKGDGKPFGVNGSIGAKGHAKRSIEILEKFFVLTEQEKNIINYHMGVYYTDEFCKDKPYMKAEYSLKELLEVFNEDKTAKLFHYCDDLVSQFVDK